MKDKIIKFRFFITFSAIGILCVLIDYSIYYSLWKMTGYIIVPKILSSIVSVSVNYILNSKFNFNNQTKINVKFYIKYIILYSILILINTAINTVFVHLSDNIQLSFCLAAVIAAFVNYFSVKLFFRKINQRLKYQPDTKLKTVKSNSD